MLTALLRREGHMVNHKRVLRLMREDNLLSLRRKGYVFTTDSNHSLPVYPNLVQRVATGEAEPAMGGRHYLHSIAG